MQSLAHYSHMALASLRICVCVKVALLHVPRVPVIKSSFNFMFRLGTATTTTTTKPSGQDILITDTRTGGTGG